MPTKEGLKSAITAALEQEKLAPIEAQNAAETKKLQQEENARQRSLAQNEKLKQWLDIMGIPQGMEALAEMVGAVDFRADNDKTTYDIVLKSRRGFLHKGQESRRVSGGSWVHEPEVWAGEYGSPVRDWYRNNTETINLYFPGERVFEDIFSLDVGQYASTIDLVTHYQQWAGSGSTKEKFSPTGMAAIKAFFGPKKTQEKLVTDIFTPVDGGRNLIERFKISQKLGGEEQTKMIQKFFVRSYKFLRMAQQNQAYVIGHKYVCPRN